MSHRIAAKITGVAGYVPPKVLTNAELEKMVATSDAWIRTRVTRGMVFPETACLVQERIGAKKAWGFDLSAACSGFAYALTVGAQFVGAGTHKKVMVIGSDTMTSVLDYTDRSTCVLSGDGAGAVLLEAGVANEGILDFQHDVDGSGGAFLYMP